MPWFCQNTDGCTVLYAEILIFEAGGSVLIWYIMDVKWYNCYFFSEDVNCVSVCCMAPSSLNVLLMATRWPFINASISSDAWWRHVTHNDVTTPHCRSSQMKIDNLPPTPRSFIKETKPSYSTGIACGQRRSQTLVRSKLKIIWWQKKQRGRRVNTKFIESRS